MIENLKMGIVNQIRSGTQILTEGEKVTTICLVIKGRVLVKNSGMQIVVGSGSFLGICDLYKGIYQASYSAMDDIMLYAFSVSNISELDKFLSGNKDYPGVVVGSLNRYIVEMDKIYTEIVTSANQLYSFFKESYKKYKEIAKANGFQAKVLGAFEELKDFVHESNISRQHLVYYKACSTVPTQVQKVYYGTNKFIYLHHIKEQAILVAQMLKEGSKVSSYIYELFNCLISDEEISLFYEIVQLAIDLKSVGTKENSIMELVDSMIDMINNMDVLLSKKVGLPITVDRERMEQTYCKLLSGDQNSSSQTTLALEDGVTIEEMRKIWEHSLERIMQYSGIEKEIESEFKAALKSYSALKDKLATDDAARNIRKKIVKHYYPIYEKVFRRYLKEGNAEPIIIWFLDYGFIDDRLLTEEQLQIMYHNVSPIKEDGPCHVYSMSQWLTAIYNGEKEPSKNEFDLDYLSNLREQRKSAYITEEQMKQYENDNSQKLSYEIMNMFKYNNRIISGQASVFIPILYEDNFPNNFERSMQTARKVNSVVNRLKDIDYSIFYREAVYSNAEKGIVREFIQVEVFPDIILFPINGTGGTMWQDISGKVRTSSGRFLIPILMENALEEIMVQLMGRFRWELCRTIQGASWNNIQYPSLTAEYCDYLQFYKKNRDLTEDKKEKLKLQMQRARGSSRETFVIDYVLWVRFESQGSIRLNKVAREILATYCPFSKELREKVATQPLFMEAMERESRERRKRLKELDLRMKVLEKEKIDIPEEVTTTMTFYHDM